MAKFKDHKNRPPLYWAYGSNMSHRQMRLRCPAAEPLTKLIVRNLQLTFRGVADARIVEGAHTPGGVYRITRACERSLDSYEGVDSGVYRKRYFKVKVNGVEEDIMFYQMKKERGIMPPTEQYLDRIIRGYRDFDVPLAPLEDALQEAWDNTKITEGMQKRFIRSGRPKLATPEFVYESAEVELIEEKMQ